MTTKRFWSPAQLAFERRTARASMQTVVEALALYENDPRPRTELDAIRVAGLEEILRVHFGHGHELRESHRQLRESPRRGRARCGKPAR